METRFCGFVAECFWPDVDEGAISAVDARIVARVAACNAAGVAVRYLGSILLREDEVLLCRFVGAEAAVRRVVEAAEVPFERLLATTTYPGQGGITP
jgi:hypothetical protein